MHRLLVFGLSHKTAPVQVRGTAALPPGRAGDLLGDLRDHGVGECVALSTCNRTEIYAAFDDGGCDEGVLAEALLRHTALNPSALRCSGYFYRDREMARHLFRVAAGLDSMVVGESEIQGQVRAAAAMAESLGVCGPALGALFRQARQVGRRVRRKTAIGAGAVSVSSVAVSVACQAFAGLRGRRALLLGAGTTAEATARALLARGLSSLLVANRTLRAAARLSTRFGATAISLDELPSQLPRVDIVIASTDAQRPLLHRRDVEVALGLRGARPLMMVDIGVPRDLDPGIGELDGVTLCDIDDLERLAHDNLHVRQREAERAERIVDDEVRRFERRQGPGAPEEGGAEVILLVPPAPTPQLLTARRA